MSLTTIGSGGIMFSDHPSGPPYVRFSFTCQHLFLFLWRDSSLLSGVISAKLVTNIRYASWRYENVIEVRGQRSIHW